MQNPYRTHYCNDISKEIIGTKVKLCGWVSRIRNHGGVVFIDLRDHSSTVQIVFNEKAESLSHTRLESVMIVDGTVIKRSDETTNDKLANGDIEVLVDKWHIESESEVLPLQITSEQTVSDEIRLRYRFLDLRREKVKNNLVLRSRFTQSLRNAMLDEDFLEINTPILTASSPEGARDYLVPSRLHQGKFYALPQAPQQFKQLLMVAGFSKYFQVAPCFRDEDSRADRSPAEFYQLDFEMSFTTQEEIIQITEKVLQKACRNVFSIEIEKFPHITYHEAILKYGTDKPDLRNPLVIQDVTSIFANSNFSIFKNNIKKGMVVRAIHVHNIGDKPRAFFDKQNTYAQSIGLPGMGYINFNDSGEAKGPIAKFLSEIEINNLAPENRKNSAIFFISDHRQRLKPILGDIRNHLGREAGVTNEEEFKFCWITDFPLFEYDEVRKKVDFSHNPFSMPKSTLNTDPLNILAYQYDLVGNGVEIASGAIRNHKLDQMYKAFKIIGYEKEDVDKSFPALTRAFKFGAPPHGGLAIGIDRLLMLLTGEKNIREIICFPMNQKAEDILMSAPSTVDESHLKELGIKTE